jgi:TPR repeat protein
MICLEGLESTHEVAGDLLELCCGHVLHKQCAIGMRRFGSCGRCPICRAVDANLTCIQKMFGEAGRCHSKGSYAEAAGLLAEILEIDPSHTKAGHGLGFLYAKGQGIEQDLGKAKALYEKAHLAGYERSTTNLGCMYENGAGVEQDFEKATLLYKQAHQAGNALATNNLAYMYLIGRGVKQSHTKAVTFFKLAHRAGIKNATFNLGYMYEKGLGVQLNLARARELYENAHQAGVPLARINLGLMYEHGLGVERDLEKAKELYELVHQSGNSDVSEILARVVLAQGESRGAATSETARTSLLDSRQ